jgi:hypothetical protein
MLDVIEHLALPAVSGPIVRSTEGLDQAGSSSARRKELALRAAKRQDD